MSGTREGGIKARQTNLKKYGKNFYKNIGYLGGINGHTGGFAADSNRAKEAGRKGGLKSKRGMSKNTPARISAIRSLLEKNATIAYIAKQLDLSPYTIQHYIYKYGLEVKK